MRVNRESRAFFGTVGFFYGRRRGSGRVLVPFWAFKDAALFSKTPFSFLTPLNAMNEADERR